MRFSRAGSPTFQRERRALLPGLRYRRSAGGSPRSPASKTLRRSGKGGPINKCGGAHPSSGSPGAAGAAPPPPSPQLRPSAALLTAASPHALGCWLRKLHAASAMPQQTASETPEWSAPHRSGVRARGAPCRILTGWPWTEHSLRRPSQPPYQ
ncbi:hypothetical protein NDU88_005349 [Pleurodeles waltl]|uniref:Uncharacterized protein n=1 Tax=Pleurodeles waltl TaxID=8319 RepID=A0AAV7SLE1_PLEWA|nr:hypothetical protein NDU88_005349 [Pleurodeles waltl]